MAGSCLIAFGRNRVASTPRLLGVLVLLLITASGCGEKVPKGGPRVEVVPVTGKVVIDGEPIEGIVVYFHRTSDLGVDFNVPYPEGITDKDGIISATTYHIGDGAPAGDYTLTFEWAQINPLNGLPSGDKFRGKFSAVKDSPHKVSVPQNGPEPYDIGTFDLTTQ